MLRCEDVEIEARNKYETLKRRAFGKVSEWIEIPGVRETVESIADLHIRTQVDALVQAVHNRRLEKSGDRMTPMLVISLIELARRSLGSKETSEEVRKSYSESDVVLAFEIIFEQAGYTVLVQDGEPVVKIELDLFGTVAPVLDDGATESDDGTLVVAPT